MMNKRVDGFEWKGVRRYLFVLFVVIVEESIPMFTGLIASLPKGDRSGSERA